MTVPTAIEPAAVLAERLTGEVIAPDHPDYEPRAASGTG